MSTHTSTHTHAHIYASIFIFSCIDLYLYLHVYPSSSICLHIYIYIHICTSLPGSTLTASHPPSLICSTGSQPGQGSSGAQGRAPPAQSRPHPPNHSQYHGVHTTAVHTGGSGVRTAGLTRGVHTAAVHTGGSGVHTGGFTRQPVAPRLWPPSAHGLPDSAVQTDGNVTIFDDDLLPTHAFAPAVWPNLPGQSHHTLLGRGQVCVCGYTYIYVSTHEYINVYAFVNTSKIGRAHV